MTGNQRVCCCVGSDVESGVCGGTCPRQWLEFLFLHDDACGDCGVGVGDYGNGGGVDDDGHCFGEMEKGSRKVNGDYWRISFYTACLGSDSALVLHCSSLKAEANL
mmetsp:Transcript_32013/g.62598  ORF Transcript_32013/g.62598 Transcript_32013/m.62598 type:complete len:106 (+) Transcript_32013:223-540(+)